MTNPSLPASKGLASSQNWRDLGPNENQYPEDLPGITINSFDFKPTERLEFFNISDYTLDPKLFSKLLPYRFMVVEAKEGKDKQGKATVEYGIAGDGYFLIYTLPISPQGITIQTPFAIETTVLADGILTESNGAPLRNITIQGTTGILPFKNVNASSAGVGGLQTVGAIQNVGAQAQGIGKVFSGPVTGQDTLEPFMENNGYAQFKKLEKFLEYWAFLSKQPQGKNLRLAFDMPKDNNTFIVNPKTFTMTRDANSPLEYKYTIQMEAWKKINLAGGGDSVGAQNALAAVTSVRQLSQAVTSVRRTIGAASNVINAISSDFNTITDVVRQVGVALKSLANLAISIVDLPFSLAIAAADSIADAATSIQEAGDSLDNYFKSEGVLSKRGKAVENAFAKIGKRPGTANTPAVSPTGVNKSALDGSGGNPAGSVSDPPDSQSERNQNPKPKQSNNPFTDDSSPLGGSIANMTSNADLFDAFNAMNIVDMKSLPASVTQGIRDEVRKARQITTQDVQDLKRKVQAISRDLARYFGGGSSEYDKVKKYVGGPNSSTNDRRLYKSEMKLLLTFNELIKTLDGIIASNVFRPRQNAILNSFDFIGSLAPASVPFNQAVGKFAAPVIADMSMAQLANYYLGDPLRELELIALNGLSAPFIDEIGTFVNLTSNANSFQLNVNSIGTMSVGQTIVLSSDTIPAFSKKIISIKKTGPSYIITVDGTNPMDSLTLADNAKIQYFKPNTINSSQLMYIPSSGSPINDLPDRLKPVGFLPTTVDALRNFSKIDFLLDLQGDIVINHNKDIALAAGLTNLIQALRLKAVTSKNSLFLHPNYGFGVEPGTSVADIKLNQLKDSILSSIKSDSRFSDVTALVVSVDGPVMRISGAVQIAGINNIIPFSFNLT